MNVSKESLTGLTGSKLALKSLRKISSDIKLWAYDVSAKSESFASDISDGDYPQAEIDEILRTLRSDLEFSSKNFFDQTFFDACQEFVSSCAEQMLRHIPREQLVNVEWGQLGHSEVWIELLLPVLYCHQIRSMQEIQISVKASDMIIYKPTSLHDLMKHYGVPSGKGNGTIRIRLKVPESIATEAKATNNLLVEASIEGKHIFGSPKLCHYSALPEIKAKLSVNSTPSLKMPTLTSPSASADTFQSNWTSLSSSQVMQNVDKVVHSDESRLDDSDVWSMGLEKTRIQDASFLIDASNSPTKSSKQILSQSNRAPKQEPKLPTIEEVLGDHNSSSCSGRSTGTLSVKSDKTQESLENEKKANNSSMPVTVNPILSSPPAHNGHSKSNNDPLKAGIQETDSPSSEQVTNASMIRILSGGFASSNKSQVDVEGFEKVLEQSLSEDESFNCTWADRAAAAIRHRRLLEVQEDEMLVHPPPSPKKNLNPDYLTQVESVVTTPKRKFELDQMLFKESEPSPEICHPKQRTRDVDDPNTTFLPGNASTRFVKTMLSQVKIRDETDTARHPWKDEIPAQNAFSFILNRCKLKVTKIHPILPDQGGKVFLSSLCHDPLTNQTFVCDIGQNKIHFFRQQDYAGIWSPDTTFLFPREILCIPSGQNDNNPFILVLDSKANQVLVFDIKGHRKWDLFGSPYKESPAKYFRGLAFDAKSGLVVTIETIEDKVSLVLFNHESGEIKKRIPVVQSKDSRCRALTCDFGKVFTTDLGLHCYFVTDLTNEETARYPRFQGSKLNAAHGIAVDDFGNILIASNGKLLLFNNQHEEMGHLEVSGLEDYAANISAFLRCNRTLFFALPTKSSVVFVQ